MVYQLTWSRASHGVAAVWETERVVHVGSWVTDTNTQVVDLREAVMKALKPFV